MLPRKQKDNQVPSSEQASSSQMQFLHDSKSLKRENSFLSQLFTDITAVRAHTIAASVVDVWILWKASLRRPLEIFCIYRSCNLSSHAWLLWFIERCLLDTCEGYGSLCKSKQMCAAVWVEEIVNPCRLLQESLGAHDPHSMQRFSLVSKETGE